MSRIAATSLVLVVLSVGGSSLGKQPTNGHCPSPVPPFTYLDSATKTILYVEADGRHLSAISFEGKIRWTRDPFVDAHLEPYRVDYPRIVQIYQPLPWMLGVHPDPKRHFVTIGFDSSQTGLVDVTTGDFFFVGQD